MAEEEKKDLDLNGDGNPGNQSDPTETAPTADGGLKNEETEAEKAERLLADGTPESKTFVVNKKTYDEKAQKAKLYDDNAVLLDKVLKNADLVEELLETKAKGNLDERVSRMEEEKKAEKRKEIKDAVMEALSIWPDFEKLWPEVQPITDSLTKSGISYREAIRRGYLAINPDAAAAEKDRIARENANRLGTFSSAVSRTPKPAYSNEKSKLTDNELRIAKALGKSSEEYAGMLERHAGWLRAKGFDSFNE